MNPRPKGPWLPTSEFYKPLPKTEEKVTIFSDKRTGTEYTPVDRLQVQFLYDGDTGYFLLSFWGIIYHLAKSNGWLHNPLLTPHKLAHKLDCPKRFKLATYTMMYRRWAATNGHVAMRTAMTLCSRDERTGQMALMPKVRRAIVEARMSVAEHGNFPAAIQRLHYYLLHDTSQLQHSEPFIRELLDPPESIHDVWLLTITMATDTLPGATEDENVTRYKIGYSLDVVDYLPQYLRPPSHDFIMKDVMDDNREFYASYVDAFRRQVPYSYLRLLNRGSEFERSLLALPRRHMPSDDITWTLAGQKRPVTLEPIEYGPATGNSPLALLIASHKRRLHYLAFPPPDSHLSVQSQQSDAVDATSMTHDDSMSTFESESRGWKQSGTYDDVMALGHRESQLDLEHELTGYLDEEVDNRVHGRVAALRVLHVDMGPDSAHSAVSEQ